MAIPATCACVSSLGKGNVAGVITGTVLSWGDDPASFRWADSRHKGPCEREEGQSQSEERREGASKG